jgi:hypothetical protein
MNRKSRRHPPKGDHFTRDASPAKNVFGRQVLGAVVPFASTATTTDGWTVLAYEVAMSESDVKLTKRDFEECVKNFGAYPCVPVTIEQRLHRDIECSRVGRIQRRRNHLVRR